ncbi:hypothetical protein BS47DRAFT_1385232 [Hydnum rufescens UP504]|uniref:Uncharacterized protein n=1 Tax=Hydnum rufescens UP504 TaxID=1448309 RepID=A0A9P6DQB5_9AGAM|nr:hypothetical protein BS47DRAFT_1385232 [Hydnum rufescens UP504]
MSRVHSKTELNRISSEVAEIASAKGANLKGHISYSPVSPSKIGAPLSVNSLVSGTRRVYGAQIVSRWSSAVLLGFRGPEFLIMVHFTGIMVLDSTTVMETPPDRSHSESLPCDFVDTTPLYVTTEDLDGSCGQIGPSSTISQRPRNFWGVFRMNDTFTFPSKDITIKKTGMRSFP